MSSTSGPFFTIPPKVGTRIQVQTQVRNGHYGLRISPQQFVPLGTSGEDGVIEFTLLPHDSTKGGFVNYSIEVDDNGQRHTVSLRLRVDESATAEAPFPTRSARELHGSQVQPLSSREIEHLGNPDIVSRGFPPRPPRESPAYELWRDIVAREFTRVIPDLSRAHHQKRSGSKSRGPGGLRNWPAQSAYQCGIIIRNNGPYTCVAGTWTVPHILPTEFTPKYVGQRGALALWVGIDDVELPKQSRSHLWQTGTLSEVNVVTLPIVSVIEGETGHLVMDHLTTPSGFVWYVPNPAISTLHLSNFPLEPGDDIMGVVGFGPLNNGVATTGGFGLWNLTRNFVIAKSDVNFGPTKPTGADAEWILERPTEPTTMLPDFGKAAMRTCWCWKPTASDTGIPCQGNASQQAFLLSPMVSYQTTLFGGPWENVALAAAGAKTTEVTFTWLAWDPPTEQFGWTYRGGR